MGGGKPGATGVSIYFPNSQLYQSAMTGPRSYTPVAQRFAQNSSWDDFLAYHYTGRTFQPETREIVVPDESIPIRGPGAGGIQVSSITTSGNVAAPGQPVLLSTDISGENVGYVYLFAGFLDQEANSIYVADMDYLESGDTREIDGVYYPDWGEGAFTMEFEWEPLMFAINDGTTSINAVLMPQSFGASSEEAMYTVDGIYTYADGGESRYARLYFSNGALRQVFGFTGTDETGSPHEITPERRGHLHRPGQMDGPRYEWRSCHDGLAARRYPDFRQPAVHMERAECSPRPVHSWLYRQRPGRQQLRDLYDDNRDPVSRAASKTAGTDQGLRIPSWGIRSPFCCSDYSGQRDCVCCRDRRRMARLYDPHLRLWSQAGGMFGESVGGRVHAIGRLPQRMRSGIA